GSSDQSMPRLAPSVPDAQDLPEDRDMGYDLVALAQEDAPRILGAADHVVRLRVLVGVSHQRDADGLAVAERQPVDHVQGRDLARWGTGHVERAGAEPHVADDPPGLSREEAPRDRLSACRIEIF